MAGRIELSRRALLAQGAALAGLAACEPVGHFPAIGGPIVATRHGPVRGFIEGGVNVFRGIRFGAPTKRFEPPGGPAPWEVPADALEYPPQAPQPGYQPPALIRSWLNPQTNSEDCLFLNLWTPAVDGEKRPVMVWLHAGGYSLGSANARVYDGCRLAARRDVVVVAPNHRLGALGHLYLSKLDPSLSHSGNLGLLDIVHALHWVRDNIAKFGGDPDRVTIFGSDGGAGKVSTLMAMPDAHGLFHRAILQSGPLRPRALSPDEASENALQFLAHLGLAPENVGLLRTLPMDNLIAPYAMRNLFRPVLDGRSLPRHPFDPDAPRLSANVPIIVGTNRDGYSMVSALGEPDIFSLSWDALPARVARVAPGAQSLIPDYRRLRPNASPFEVLIGIVTEANYRRDAIMQAERKAAQGAVYMYRLDWRTPVDGGKWGATQALDMAFTFDNVEFSSSLIGDAEAEAQILADAMSGAWTAFAANGSPDGEKLLRWPEYDAVTRATMVFDDPPRIENDPDRAARILFATHELRERI